MSKAKYIVRLESQRFGKESTKWDTLEEAQKAVESIRSEATQLQDGVLRHVRIEHNRKLIGVNKKFWFPNSDASVPAK